MIIIDITMIFIVKGTRKYDFHSQGGSITMIFIVMGGCLTPHYECRWSVTMIDLAD